MKNRYFLVTAIFLSLFVFISNAQEWFQSAKLEKLWETTEGLNVPESAFYYSNNKTIYVSNICGAPKEKDGIGFISLLNAKGEFLEKEWLSGLNAPKGLQIFKDKLYVADLTEVLEIDIVSAQILKRYTNTQAVTLNDVAIDARGTIYISDTKTNRIYKLGEDSLELFLPLDPLQTINGLWVYKDFLLCGANNHLVSIDIATKEMKTLSEYVGYIDGIVSIGKKQVIVSDWGGKVQYIRWGKTKEILLNTGSFGVNAADLGWIPKEKILLVPTFLDNKIVAYHLKK